MFHERRIPGHFVESGYDRQLALDSVKCGWAHLINDLFDFIDTQNIKIKIIQVKEKYGGLRIYTDVINESLDEKIIELERASFKICEDCGLDGHLRGGSRYRTLCEEHANGQRAVREF